MKRMLAALTALMMLIPVLAFGEAAHYTLRFDCDEEQLSPWLQENGVTDSGVLKLIPLIAGLRLEMYASEEEQANILFLNDTDIVKAWTRRAEDGSYLLLVDAAPDTVVKTPAVEETAAAQIMAGTDALTLLGVATEMAKTAGEWMNGLPCREETGIFMGDAFGAGDTQQTWEISRNDVTVLAMLLSRKLDGLVPAENGEGAADWQALKQELQDAILQDALTGKESWILRRVLRDGTAIGLSLTCLYDGEQVATVSVGLDTPDLRIVAGLGLDGNVYYADAIMTAESDSEATLALNYTVRFYQDPHHDGLQGAAVEAENSLGRLEGRISATLTDRFTLGGEATLTRNGTAALREVWEASVDGKTGLIGAKDTVFIGENPRPAFGIFLDGETTEEYPAAAWPEGDPIAMDQDQEAMTAWISQIATTAGFKLIFQVPAEVLILLFK